MNDRVVAFDINAGLVPSAAPIAARAALPAAEPRARHSGRAHARAQVSAVYAGLLGNEIAVADVLEQLQIAGPDADTGLPGVCTAMRALGMAARIDAVPSPGKTEWPALAEMSSGQIVLVLGQTDATLQIYDTTCPDMRAEVPAADFAQVYAGRILRAKTTLHDLESRHVPAVKKRHWFWGEFSRYKRQMGEVAAGSLVANILAVNNA